LIKKCNLLIPRPPLRTSKLQEKPSALKKEHPSLQKMIFNDFLLLLWVILALLETDPDFESGNGSNPDPDIQQ
jgi:hypothetical protein